MVVGIGPGGALDRTRRAEEAILRSDTVVGYAHYLAQITDLTAGKTVVASGMRQEVERCREALRLAREGKSVALVSSGDAGIYGMAGLALELAAAEDCPAPIEIVPGVTAASAAAARLGALLTLDFACISLSDLLVPWATVRARLEAIAAADLVAALYNPRSSKRQAALVEAAEIFRKHRPPSTPVGVATALGSAEERIHVSDLAQFLDLEITMRSIVLIGNRSSKRLGPWLVTPRGYPI